MVKVLILDDEESAAMALQAVLSNEGYDVEIATDWKSGLDRAKQRESEVHVVVADLYWKVAESKRREPKGLDILDELRVARPQLPVILITAVPATETVIEASKRGAYDFVTKPKAKYITKARPTNEKELEELLNAVREAAASRLPGPDEPESGGLGPQVGGSMAVGRSVILGRSRVMQKVFKEIGRAAARPVTVLVRGETGTGKELVARALHEHSDRSQAPFITVNCVAIPESLLESELFGHEKSAFTGATTQRVGRFEQANRGTIFLDEIGDMSVTTQAKLLRVLQDKTIRRIGGSESFQVDVRVIAATHRDLERAVEAKQFRRDLYYRLNDVVIRLPPLRERPEDIRELAAFFVQQHAAQLGGVEAEIDPDALHEPGMSARPINCPRFDQEAIACLQRQPWPGNVRELRNVVRRALLLTRGPRIDLTIVGKALDETRVLRRHTEPTARTPVVARQPLAAYVSELLDSAERGDRGDVAAALNEWAEREIYGQAIRLSGWDQTKAAGWLGVSRPTFREKLSRYHLRADAPSERDDHAEQLV